MPGLIAVSLGLSQVPFLDVLNELMINRPDRMISSVSRENRIKIQAFEIAIAVHTDDQLLKHLAPWIDENGTELKTLIAALRTCVYQRHPEWKQLLNKEMCQIREPDDKQLESKMD